MKQLYKNEEEFLNFIRDLKTPTASQVCALETLLKTTKIDADEKDLIELTLNSCSYTHKLLDTYLGVSKIKSQKYLLKYENFNIVDILNEILNDLKILFKYNEVKIEKIYKDKILINADKAYIKTVIENFILNGLKMSDKNTSLKIKIKTYKNEVVFEVENKSSYLNEEVLNKLFKNDKPIFNSSINVSGFYLSKEIINAHFGKVMVKSNNNINILGFSLPL